MPIRYDKNFNDRIYSVVRNYNKRVQRLQRKDRKNIPQHVKVSELKARYSNRADLNKELNLLESFNKRDLQKTVETKGGAEAISWHLDYLKANTKNAIKYFERERDIELKKNPIYPSQKMRLNEVEEAINTLQQDLNYLNQSQFNSYSSYIKEYLDSPRRMMNGYRGFLYQVETAMRMTGYEKSQINSLFNKFKTLTPPQFLELYKTNNLINRLYEIVKSPVHGEAQLTLAEDDARELLDALIEEIDDDIANLTTK